MISKAYSYELQIVAGIAILAAVLALVGIDLPPLTVVPGLLLIFVLPGYAIMEVTSVNASVSVGERVLLSVGTSVVVTILCGLALNWTPFGLQRGSFAGALALVTLIACTVSWATRRSGAAEHTNTNIRLAKPTFKLNTVQISIFGIALLLAIASLGISRYATVQQDSTATYFTQLWIVDDGQSSTSNNTGASVGVRNQETSDLTYNVELLDGGNIVQRWNGVRISRGAQWTQSVNMTRGTSPMKLEARLYKGDNPGTVYRRATLTTGGSIGTDPTKDTH